MSPEVRDAMDSLMLFLKDRVYLHSEPKLEEGKAGDLLARIFDFCISDVQRLGPYLREHPETYRAEDPVAMLCSDIRIAAQVVTDYVASMTDRMALHVAQGLVMPHIYI